MQNRTIAALAERLRTCFPLSKSRLDTLCLLIVGTIASRTVNLGHIASERGGTTLLASTYRRLQRFFQREAGGYRVRRELREMVLFAHHNVIRDPPFSHLDLIACRNLLIYLNRPVQERLIETFHFALRPGGYLFLGTSETADGAIDLFVQVDKLAHIYESRMVSSRPSLPIPDRSMPPTPYRSCCPRRTEIFSEPDDRSFRKASNSFAHHCRWPALVAGNDLQSTTKSAETGVQARRTDKRQRCDAFRMRLRKARDVRQHGRRKMRALYFQVLK